MLPSRLDPREIAVMEELWANPAHWNRGAYSCADDPRLLVRDRARLGWTLNMAHRRAQTAIWGFLMAVIASVVAIGVMAINRGNPL